MLHKKVKQKAKETVVWAIVIMICVVMIFWTYGIRDQGGRGEQKAILKINGEEIDRNQVYSVYRRISSLYQRYSQTNTNPSFLKNLAIEQIIRDKLKEQKANTLHFRVSDQAIRDMIQEDPSFQENGVFQKNRYFQWLENQRLSPSLYEVHMRTQLKSFLLSQLLKESIKPSEPEIVKEFLTENQKLKFEYVMVDANKLPLLGPLGNVQEWLKDPQNKKRVTDYYEQNKKLKYTNTAIESVEQKIAEELYRQWVLQNQAEKIANDILQLWMKNDVLGYLKERKLKVEVGQEVSLRALYFEKLGYQPNLASELFSIGNNTVYSKVVKNQDKFFVLRVKAKLPFDLAIFDKKKTEFEKTIFMSKEQSLELSFTEWLRKKASVEIDENFLK